MKECLNYFFAVDDTSIYKSYEIKLTIFLASLETIVMNLVLFYSERTKNLVLNHKLERQPSMFQLMKIKATPVSFSHFGE